MKKKIFISILFLLIIGKITYIRIYQKDYYQSLLDIKTNNYVYGTTAKRGRILDRNGIVLVDNIGVKTIYFNDLDYIKESEKIATCYKLAQIINIKEASEYNQKIFFLEKETYDYLNDFEKDLFKKRKISKEDITDIKLSRTDISSFNSLDKKAAQIYYLMNKDYKYSKKEIIKNVSDEDYAKIMELNLPGITGEISWQRSYPYNETLKSIFGTVGKISKENKKEYLDKGYSISDVVGLSYLEYEYDDYLKGTKAVYKLINNKPILIKDEIPGKDLYLNIDINAQLELEKIVKDEILIAKSKPNTEYFNEIYVSSADPKTGNIIALLGMRYLDNDTFSDITSDIISSSFTVGSVVKGATIQVGYNQNIITPGKYITDSCVKLYYVPQKCSFKRLGRINDITALANSSNYYQYLIAIGLTNKKYTPNMQLNVTEKEFNIYRDTLKTMGLGTKTEIDLPNELQGIKGSVIADDLLLNLAIGQYDTYTNIQILNYINTIATGNRYSLNLVNNIKDTNDLVYENIPKLLNTLEISEENLNRVKEGLHEVLKTGTGKGAVNINYNPAGKTGTSESFYNGIKTISTSLAVYFPIDDPKYSIAIIAPNISHNNGKKDYAYGITKHISSRFSDFLFENY